MSKLHDQWVSMAIADDSLVAHQLLLLRCHHLSSVNPWTCRQRRTTRLPAAAARASPTNSLDGFEGSTRPIAPMRSSEPKPLDKTATFPDNSKSSSSKKKRTISQLRRVEQEKKEEGKNLRDELEATYLKYDRRRAEGERLKKTKEELLSRRYLETDVSNIDRTEDHIVENESAASEDGKSGGQQPRIFLPDLNEAPVEDFTEFVGFNQ
ncbi:uncharacterized protein LOC111242565 isoform X1 [Vigna radiata var. radiata]|uniref:Uncharacterized protein LOC111242565 isoform X1 n=1 Tax=Vigna radiata var. radiata TaxID=3916 RepID=A0A3Q0FDJ0_VIGRR|nr:uncharacterized protein LOC111242565 isoform X1 [Vigna radiata var. radiata]